MSSKFSYTLSTDGRTCLFGIKRNKCKLALSGYELRVFKQVMLAADGPRKEAALEDIYNALAMRAGKRPTYFHLGIKS